MRIAVAGPPESFKSRLSVDLLADDWIRKIFKAINPTTKCDLKILDTDSSLIKAKSIQLLLNEHLSSIYNNNNCIYDTCLLDVLARCLDYQDNRILSPDNFNIYFSQILSKLHLYDKIIVLTNSDSDKQLYYDTACKIVSANKRINNIEIHEEVVYTDILNDIKNQYKENIDRNEKNSYNWISEHREDYFSSGTSQTSSV